MAKSGGSGGMSGTMTVNALELWADLEIPTAFSEWIKSEIRNGAFKSGQDFRRVKVTVARCGRGGKYQIDFFITPEMAEKIRRKTTQKRCGVCGNFDPAIEQLGGMCLDCYAKKWNTEHPTKFPKYNVKTFTD